MSERGRERERERERIRKKEEGKDREREQKKERERERERQTKVDSCRIMIHMFLIFAVSLAAVWVCSAPALEAIQAVAWKLAQGVLFFLLVCLGVICTAPIPWKGSKEDEAAEDTPLAGTMEDQALKKAELAALQQARCKAEKEADETDSEAEEKTFEAWAEHVFPRLTPEHQAKAASVKLTGLGSCSKCRWGAGCSSCSFPHACLFALREESNLAYRP